MSRRGGDVVMSAVVVLLVGWMVWDARDWPVRARVFPWSIGFVVLALAAAQLVSAVRGARAPARAPVVPAPSAVPAEIEAAVHPPVEDDRSDALGARGGRVAGMAAWLFGFALFLVLFGFKVGGGLLTLVFLRLAAREGWRMSIGFAVGTYLFFLLLFDLALNVPFPPGLAAQWLGIDSFDGFIVDPIRQLLQSR